MSLRMYMAKRDIEIIDFKLVLVDAGDETAQ